jgi:hypothetical protein
MYPFSHGGEVALAVFGRDHLAVTKLLARTQDIVGDASELATNRREVTVRVFDATRQMAQRGIMGGG